MYVIYVCNIYIYKYIFYYIKVNVYSCQVFRVMCILPGDAGRAHCLTSIIWGAVACLRVDHVAITGCNWLVS